MREDTQLPSDAKPQVPLVLHAVLAATALAAVVAPALIVASLPDAPAAQLPAMPRRVVPKAELPPVEPVAVLALAPDDARAINAAIPFSKLPNPAARAFSIYGESESQERAIDCLAAAQWYEAGDDPVGERAVAQVVINRLRHPAFPKTVCGVVFQGSERRTGCQFTFTCDGALARIPSEDAWGRARTIARQALTGTVYRPVGLATHYHTDWVVPYWSASLDKVTEVNTHLFFRWTGWWGTPPAFSRAYAGAEPLIAKLARISAAHRSGTLEDALAAGTIDPATLTEAALPKAMPADSNTFLVTLDKRIGADDLAALAVRTCGERPYCKFMGWTDKSRTPAALPLSEAQIASMSFSYLRDQRQLFAKALWNCAEFKRPSPVQCMRQSLIPRTASTLPKVESNLPKPELLVPPPRLIESKAGQATPPQPAPTAKPNPAATTAPAKG